MNSLQLLGAIEMGLIYSFIAIGVYITFKVIDFPDLTVDGSFTLGAAVCASMIVAGYNCYLSTMVASICGGIAGGVTGYLNTRLKILGLLSGIMTMTALYSVNLRIMGRPNIALISDISIFNGYSVILVCILLLLGLVFLVAWFFSTNIGLSIRAVGINPKVSCAYGIDVGRARICALFISNLIVSFGGALFAQSQGFADISMGTGTVIIGLASVIIGTSVVSTRKILVASFACIAGSLLYRIVISIALSAHDIGLEASDLNLITAVIVVMVMVLTKNNPKSINK